MNKCLFNKVLAKRDSWIISGERPEITNREDHGSTRGFTK
jgi:hypothetical protein